MAIRDARNMIKQWWIYEPSRFKAVSGGSSSLTQDQKYVPVSFSGMSFQVIEAFADKGTLLSDLFELALMDLEDPYLEYRKLKRQNALGSLSSQERSDLLPEWKVELDICEKSTIETFERLGLPSPTSSDCKNTFWLSCRNRFKVLERYHRLVKHLEVTPDPTLSSAIKRNDLQTDSEEATPKRRRIANLCCDSLMPYRRAKKDPGKLCCWICGYSITQKTMVIFECCDNSKVAHKLCWHNQVEPGANIMCSNVTHYYKRGSRIPDHNVRFSDTGTSDAPVAANPVDKIAKYGDRLYCSTCQQVLDPSDPLVKDHLKYVCTGIPSSPLKPGYSRIELSRRMAALGSKKRLYSHETQIQPSNPTQSSGSQDRLGVG